MEFSSIDQSRFAKYSIIIKAKSSRSTSRSELDNLNIDENKTDQFVADYRNVKVADLLKLVGEDEHYQRVILFFLCLFNFAYAFIAFMIPYVFYEPGYMCFDQDKNKRLCSHAEACSNHYGFEVTTTITSVISEYKLYCNRKGLIELSEAIFVVSGGCAAFILGMLSDRFGRKPIFLLSYFLTVSGTLISLLAPNLAVIVFGNILSWSGMDSFFSMVFIYINEVIGSDLRSKATGFLFLSWGLGEIMINVLNIWITHYKVNFLIQFLPLTLLGVTYLTLQESPYLLYKLKNIGELYSSLKFIGLKNGRSEQFVTQELDRRLAIDKVVQGNLGDIDSFRLKRLNPVRGGQFKGYLRYFHKLCKDKSIVWRLIGVTLITGNIYIGYSLSLLIPQRIGLSNIYLNGIFLGVSEIISYLIAIPIGSRVQRRHLNFMCAFSIFVLDLLLLVLDFTGDSIDSQLLHWTQTMLSCTIKLVFCINYALIFNYCSELFPTKIRGLTLGMCVFFGRFMVLFTFYLQMITDHFQIHPMIGTIFGCILVMPISLFMPETVGSGISN